MDDSMQVIYLLFIVASSVLLIIPYETYPMVMVLTWFPLFLRMRRARKTLAETVEQHEKI